MGEIVTFKPRASARSRQADCISGSAEILFFIGVRYERQAEPAATAVGNRLPPHGSGAGKTPGGRKRRA